MGQQLVREHIDISLQLRHMDCKGSRGPISCR